MRSSFAAAVVPSIALGSLVAGCESRDASTLRVFAASSFREPLSAIAADFEAETGVRVVGSFGPSSALAAQLRAGARADVFLSADEASMDAVASLVEPDTRFDLLANRLSVVVNAREPAPIADVEDLRRPEVNRIALADLAGAWAGGHATRYLAASGVLSGVESKIVRCLDARAALAAVESGDADCGFVHRTDAATSSRALVAFDVVGPHAPVIRHPAARLRESTSPRAADRFLRRLREAKATRAFAEAGFALPT